MLPLDTVPWPEIFTQVGLATGAASVVTAITALFQRTMYARRESEYASESIALEAQSSDELVALTHATTERLEAPSATPEESWSEELIRVTLEDQRRQARRLEERAQERYAYSKRMATASFWVGVPAMIVILIGAALVLAGLTPAAVLTAVSGALAAGASGLVYKVSSDAKADAQRDEDAMRRQLESHRKLAIGASLLREVADPNKRDDAYVRLAVDFASP